MIVKTFCARMDHGGCGIVAHVENGKITKIEGDPDSPISRGTICAKGITLLKNNVTFEQNQTDNRARTQDNG